MVYTMMERNGAPALFLSSYFTEAALPKIEQQVLVILGAGAILRFLDLMRDHSFDE